MSVFRFSLGDGSGLLPFGIDCARGRGITAISVHGVLDCQTVDELARPLLEAVGSGDEVIVNLCGCDFVDSAVVAAIAVAHQTMQRDGSGLRLVARLDSQPVRVLRITGLYSDVPVFFTLAAAVNDAQAATAKEHRSPRQAR